jgi:hypothetical protein
VVVSEAYEPNVSMIPMPITTHYLTEMTAGPNALAVLIAPPVNGTVASSTAKSMKPNPCGEIRTKPGNQVLVRRTNGANGVNWLFSVQESAKLIKRMIVRIHTSRQHQNGQNQRRSPKHLNEQSLCPASPVSKCTRNGQRPRSHPIDDRGSHDSTNHLGKAYDYAQFSGFPSVQTQDNHLRTNRTGLTAPMRKRARLTLGLKILPVTR